MPFNGNKITEYKDGRSAQSGTPARGSTFNNEFDRLYDNDNYLKSEVDKLSDLTPNKMLITDKDGKVAVAEIPANPGRLIRTNAAGKGIEENQALTPNRILKTDGNGLPVATNIDPRTYSGCVAFAQFNGTLSETGWLIKLPYIKPHERTISTFNIRGSQLGVGFDIRINVLTDENITVGGYNTTAELISGQYTYDLWFGSSATDWYIYVKSSAGTAWSSIAITDVTGAHNVDVRDTGWEVTLANSCPNAFKYLRFIGCTPERKNNLAAQPLTPKKFVVTDADANIRTDIVADLQGSPDRLLVTDGGWGFKPHGAMIDPSLPAWAFMVTEPGIIKGRNLAPNRVVFTDVNGLPAACPPIGYLNIPYVEKSGCLEDSGIR